MACSPACFHHSYGRRLDSLWCVVDLAGCTTLSLVFDFVYQIIVEKMNGRRVEKSLKPVTKIEYASRWMPEYVYVYSAPRTDIGSGLAGQCLGGSLPH
jgi:hypothetical protein